MESLTTNYVTRAEIWLCITTLLYFLMNGAQIFETLVFAPKWMASPPDSFKLLLDGKGTSLKIFWIVLHSLHEITFVLAIIFCWKIEPVRNWLLILFALHFAVRVWTLSYFAPNIIDFQKIAETPSLAQDLIRRTSLWQTLNYVRVAIFVAISFGLIPLSIKVFRLYS
ncbi:transposase [Flavobacterium supellecticarium]|uniref:Transposase n=1 Tax=Flavobacterium supellecticarium TaxID=2565924 RepID=A0A4S3ZVH1_9FLAO|nr:transposase [Flavobacterium supellecticarium]THF49818.1 transposase [Flavobacterium supellecticarium]